MTKETYTPGYYDILWAAVDKGALQVIAEHVEGSKIRPVTFIIQNRADLDRIWHWDFRKLYESHESWEEVLKTMITRKMTYLEGPELDFMKGAVFGWNTAVREILSCYPDAEKMLYGNSKN